MYCSYVYVRTYVRTVRYVEKRSSTVRRTGTVHSTYGSTCTGTSTRAVVGKKHLSIRRTYVRCEVYRYGKVRYRTVRALAKSCPLCLYITGIYLHSGLYVVRADLHPSLKPTFTALLIIVNLVRR